MQGGQGEGSVLPAPRIIRSRALLVAAIAIFAPPVVVVVVTAVVVAVIVEYDGLRLTARGVLGLLSGVGGGRGGCPPVKTGTMFLGQSKTLKWINASDQNQRWTNNAAMMIWRTRTNCLSHLLFSDLSLARAICSSQRSSWFLSISSCRDFWRYLNERI